MISGSSSKEWRSAATAARNSTMREDRLDFHGMRRIDNLYSSAEISRRRHAFAVPEHEWMTDPASPIFPSRRRPSTSYRSARLPSKRSHRFHNPSAILRGPAARSVHFRITLLRVLRDFHGAVADPKGLVHPRSTRAVFSIVLSIAQHDPGALPWRKKQKLTPRLKCRCIALR